MATISKRAGPRGVRWRAQVRKRGRKPVSRTFRTKAEADSWAALEESTGTAAAGRYTVADAFDRWEREEAPRRPGGRWEGLRIAAWRRQEWAAKRLSYLTQGDVADLRAAWLGRVSGATVAREMTLLATILEAARRDWGWLGANPARGVRRPPEPPPRRRGITADEIDRIVLALGFLGVVERPGHQVAVAFLLALETAMRAGEMIGLAWERVDLERRVARLPKTKNGDAREVALSARAVELLRLLPASRPFTISSASLDALFRKARDRAGIADLHFHDSRGEAITRLAKRLDVLELARMIGHRDLNSLMFYYRASAEEIAAKL